MRITTGGENFSANIQRRAWDRQQRGIGASVTIASNMVPMTSDLYRHHVNRAAAAVRHLGGAVRGSRAFFIYRDRSDASQPSIIACHPPLDDSAMLDCLGGGQLVWESVSDNDGNRALVGLATDDA